jgi:hypothetical protein
MQNKLANNTLKVSTNMLLLFLFLLILEDYLLTYMGINTLNIIEEANPLMQEFMSLPFYAGLVLKSIIALVPILLLKSTQHNFNPIEFKKIMLIPILLQLVPYTAHAIWIYKYFTVVLLK